MIYWKILSITIGILLRYVLFSGQALHRLRLFWGWYYLLLTIHHYKTLFTKCSPKSSYSSRSSSFSFFQILYLWTFPLQCLHWMIMAFQSYRFLISLTTIRSFNYEYLQNSNLFSQYHNPALKTLISACSLQTSCINQAEIVYFNNN